MRDEGIFHSKINQHFVGFYTTIGTLTIRISDPTHNLTYQEFYIARDLLLYSCLSPKRKTGDTPINIL